MLQHEGDGTIRDIEYSDYEGLYRQWKNKDLTDEEVARVGGASVVGLDASTMGDGCGDSA